jgi:hypothetical protein
MADGFDLHLDEERAAKLKALADMVDMSPEDYAALLIDREIDQAAQPPVDPDPAIDRAIIERMKRTGEGTPWSELRDRLRARRRR